MRRKPAKGWAKVAPKTKGQREAIGSRCGVSRVFLDPKHLKYPVISRYSRDCKPDCRGLLSAKRRADQYHHPSIAKKAQRLAVRHKCAWAR